MDSDPSSRTAELYVRSLRPRGSHSGQDAIVERLEELASIGALDEYRVHVWGDGLALESSASRTTPGRQIRECVEDFQQWATVAGMSLESFFPTETVHSKIIDREYTAIQFPMVTLAEYEDGVLQFVSPCSDGDTVITVFDRLDALAESMAGSQSPTTQRDADAEQVPVGHESNE